MTMPNPIVRVLTEQQEPILVENFDPFYDPFYRTLATQDSTLSKIETLRIASTNEIPTSQFGDDVFSRFRGHIEQLISRLYAPSDLYDWSVATVRQSPLQVGRTATTVKLTLERQNIYLSETKSLSPYPTISKLVDSILKKYVNHSDERADRQRDLSTLIAARGRDALLEILFLLNQGNVSDHEKFDMINSMAFDYDEQTKYDRIMFLSTFLSSRDAGIRFMAIESLMRFETEITRNTIVLHKRTERNLSVLALIGAYENS
ncbi:MAG: hypothetical protein WD673_02075 [Alphaproteobacteria bacterium]